jgi:hypothetical protein
MKKQDAIAKWIDSINWKVGNFSMLPIFFGTLMALIDITMMSIAKLISIGKLNTWVGTPLAVGLYSLEPLIFIRAMNYESMTAMNLIWDLTSDVLVTLNGVLFFGESIKGLRWVAVLMSIVSLGLFAYTDN